MLVTSIFLGFFSTMFSVLAKTNSITSASISKYILVARIRKRKYLEFLSCLSIDKISKPHSSVGSVADLRTEGRWFDPRIGQYFFPKIDDSHCNWFHSSLTAVRCFDKGYVGKQPVAGKNIETRPG